MEDPHSLCAGEQAPDAGEQDEPGLRHRQGEVRQPAGQDQRVPEQILQVGQRMCHKK